MERSDKKLEDLKSYVIEIAMLEFIKDNNLIDNNEYKKIKNKIEDEYAKYNKFTIIYGIIYTINFYRRDSMPITQAVLDKINKPYRFNMVNLNNEEFIKLGLEPLYLTVHPQYINLENNIFYNNGIAHYECQLSNDIERILRIMNSNLYDRFEDVIGFLNDDYPIRFQIYNKQIFFNDQMALSVYKNHLNIRNEINKKYNLKDEFYEPTREEMHQDYGWEYFKKNYMAFGNNFEYCRLNLTPQEYFNMIISSKRQELGSYTSPDELNDNDLSHWLNYNANIFANHICSRETTGVYNQETMKLINSLLETKLDIYNFFDAFSKQAKNWQDAIKKLLMEFGVYSEFIPKEIDNDNPFDNDGKFDERSHWNIMFHKASFDMLVQFIGFDKIETQLSKTITTSKPNIYEEFFNPLVMEYNIVQLPKLIFDEKKQQFRWISPNEVINSGINRECENEIKLIKKYVPYEKRHLYLRD